VKKKEKKKKTDSRPDGEKVPSKKKKKNERPARNRKEKKEKKKTGSIEKNEKQSLRLCRDGREEGGGESPDWQDPLYGLKGKKRGGRCSSRPRGKLSPSQEKEGRRKTKKGPTRRRKKGRECFGREEGGAIGEGVRIFPAKVAQPGKKKKASQRKDGRKKKDAQSERRITKKS